MYYRRIQFILSSQELETIYITSPENLRYYSGFTGGEGALVLSQDSCLLFTDSRYLVQAAQEAPDFVIVDTAKTKPTDYLKEHRVETLGFEGDYVTARAYEELKKELMETRFCSVSRAILGQRSRKDEKEKACLRQAAALADEAFAHILPMLRPGVTEKEIAMALEWYMRKNGASAPSFPIICASGARSAMPHGVATDKKLETGDFVTMDFGCFFEGYASDMTRTVVLGQASGEQKKIYETVLAAQEKALSEICAGKSGQEIDAAARTVIQNAGYGAYFGHALGHGTGLEIHERPVLSPRSEDVLAKDMLVTVEPGIYIENFGGVRIEDLVIVTEDGCENLTRSTKELLEL